MAACDSFKQAAISLWHQYKSHSTDCYFVEKAFNAEKAGAKAILVMDDREEQLLTMAAPEDHPEIAKLREDITIPTALIRRVSTVPSMEKRTSFQDNTWCLNAAYHWQMLLIIGKF